MDLRHGHNQSEPTHLYVMECSGRVKIGIAFSVEERLALLQLACPLKINLLHKRLFASRTTARLAERHLHARFASQRLWGEWFEVTPTVAVDAAIAVEEEPAPEHHVRRRWKTRQVVPAPAERALEPSREPEYYVDVAELRPLADVLDFGSPLRRTHR